MNEFVYGSTNGWMDGWMGRQTDEWVDGYEYWQADKWMDE